MAGGSFTTGAVTKERAEQYKGRVTPYVIVACIVAATGGSLFGYDIGISGSSIIHTFMLSYFLCSGSFTIPTLNEIQMSFGYCLCLIVLLELALKKTLTTQVLNCEL